MNIVSFILLISSLNIPRYICWCLFVYSGVQHMLSCVCAQFVVVLCTQFFLMVHLRLPLLCSLTFIIQTQVMQTNDIVYQRQISLVEQELPTLPEHLSSPSVFSAIRVTRSLVLCVCFVDRCLSFCTVSFGHCVVCSSSIYGF